MKLAFVVYSDKFDEPFDFQIATSDPVYTARVSLLFLLIRSGITPDRFRQCPECDSIFLLLRKPDKRQFYCSPRCAARVANRNSRRAKREVGKRMMRMGGGSKSSKRRQDASNRGKSELPEQNVKKKP